MDPAAPDPKRLKEDAQVPRLGPCGAEGAPIGAAAVSLCKGRDAGAGELRGRLQADRRGGAQAVGERARPAPSPRAKHDDGCLTTSDPLRERRS